MQPKASILLVDDQPRNLEVLVSILESPDYELVNASSAEEALLALLQRDFCAIVTDIRMPGISGLELAQIVKQRKRTEAVPILFLTAHLLDETDVLRGYSVGAVDYLSKPINPEILRSKVAVFVDLSRKNQALAAMNVALKNEVREREQAQQLLHTANEELETRVRERTEELNAHRDRLEELVIIRTQALERSHERLRQAERLASVGTLAAGLGHDMSNLLLPIRARITGLSSAALDAGAAADVVAIGEAAAYLQRLASGLRLLAVDPDRADEREGGTALDAWWRDVEGILRAGVPRGVRLEGHFPASLPRVAIAASRLTQAVFNLVQNAGEAMTQPGSTPGAGLVRLTASIGSDDQPVESGADAAGPRHENPPTGQVMVRIEDNGPGMRPEVARRCFEPYFSTKVRSVSTGMGLPMVRAWIDAAGGSVHLRTEPEKGTTFTLRLPAFRAHAADPQAESPGLCAAISLADKRSAQIIASMIETASVIGRPWEDPGPPDADVWIVSAAPARVLNEFLAGGEHRRALIFSDPADGATDQAGPTNGAFSPVLDASRACFVGHSPRTSDLRRALKDAIEHAAARELGRGAGVMERRG